MKMRRIFLVFTLLTAILGCQARNEKTVPDALVGVWKTSAPKYADRPFEITKKVIVFGTGDRKTEIYAITNVKVKKVQKKVQKHKNSLYTITYMNRAGQHYKLSFYYYPVNDGVIRFKNQQAIRWMKEER